MNLLTNRIIFIKTGLLLLVILFFLGCKKQKNKIGFDGANRLPSGTYFTDTITVKSEIVLVSDSITTSNVTNGIKGSYLLVGAYHDPYLGNISAEGYTQLQLNTQFVELPAATADSAYIYLNYIGHYGNPNIAQTLNVYALTAPLLDTVGGTYPYFSNSQGISYYPAPIGSATFNVTSDSANFVIVKVKNTTNPYGMNYIQAILNGSKNNTDFVAQFPGIAILPANNTDGAIMQLDGGSSNAVFRIFYTQYGLQKSYDLTYGLGARKFYKIKADRTSKNTSTLANSYDSISTSLTSNECYIQAGTGLRVRLSFPYLNKLREAHSNIAIMGAQLVLTASPNSDTTDFKINNGLLLMKTNHNLIKKSTTGVINYVQPDDANPLATTGALLTYPINGVYLFNVRSYIQAVLLGQIPNDPVIVSPYPLQSNVNRLVFNDNKSAVNPLKLNLYFTTGK